MTNQIKLTTSLIIQISNIFFNLNNATMSSCMLVAYFVLFFEKKSIWGNVRFLYTSLNFKF